MALAGYESDAIAAALQESCDNFERSLQEQPDRAKTLALWSRALTLRACGFNLGLRHLPGDEVKKEQTALLQAAEDNARRAVELSSKAALDERMSGQWHLARVLLAKQCVAADADAKRAALSTASAAYHLLCKLAVDGAPASTPSDSAGDAKGDNSSLVTVLNCPSRRSQRQFQFAAAL